MRPKGIQNATGTQAATPEVVGVVVVQLGSTPNRLRRIGSNDSYGGLVQQMKKELIIVVIAETGGDCTVVGVSRSTDSAGEWIELKKASGNISESDLKLKSGEKMRPLDVVSVDMTKSGDGDYVWNTSLPAELVTRLEAEARTSFLYEHARSTTRKLDLKSMRFALIGPVYPAAAFTKSGAGCEARFIAPEISDGEPVRVIDPKWLKLGISFLSRTDEVELDSEYLERALGIHKIYAVVGPSDDLGLSVLCVHTIPDYSTELFFPMI